MLCVVTSCLFAELRAGDGELAEVHRQEAVTLDGAIVLADYGYAEREYYHPQRVDGTLRERARFGSIPVGVPQRSREGEGG